MANIVKDDSNNPIPQYQSESGNFEPLKGSNGAAFMQLTGSNLQDSQAVPTKPMAKTVTIANAVAITNTATFFYNLITDGGLTEAEIRRYRNIKISLVNSHNQTATITVYTAVRALDLTTGSGGGIIYTEANILAASSGRMVIQEKALGTGGDSRVKVVPALNSVHSNIIVGIQFGVAPSSGSTTIVVELS